MAKKNFDTFLQNVRSPKPSPAEIEAMTREVHQPTAKPAPASRASTPRPKAAPNLPPPAADPVSDFRRPQEPGRRGRKPKPREAERLLRVSVDLPESLFIALGARCVKEKTDKMTYVRRLVERDLNPA
ncbi:MAG: hypothetical protein ABIQ93_15095 [Saprospiraceae bacterium]